ncbi:MAG: sugar phosphate isomerase/epimerase, partial [Planctomycetota bacterium]
RALHDLEPRHTVIGLPEVLRDLDARRRELERFGLQCGTLHGECDVRRADVARRVAEQMPAFDALHCAIMFTSARADDTPFETVVERLRAAGDAAAEHGVTIALETHPDLATNGAVARRTMEAVAHPNVRINFDTANIHFYNRDTDTVRELEAVIDFIAAVHLKDTNGGYRAWHFPALGEGVVDFPAVFARLDAAGYTGPYTLEIEGIEGETRTEQLVHGRIVKSVEYLRRLGRCA